MHINLGTPPSLVTHIIAEMRDVTLQKDRARFRDNLTRLGEIFAYEISKHLSYSSQTVKTPLGTAPCHTLESLPVLATILRAGLPLHAGLLRHFAGADCCFVSAYRKHTNSAPEFTIEVEYLASPDLTNRTLILADPMLATGRSLVSVLKRLLSRGEPKSIHIVSVIASEAGISHVAAAYPSSTIWTAAVDKDLNSHSYIVPGLGDAGDLAFGEKL